MEASISSCIYVSDKKIINQLYDNRSGLYNHGKIYIEVYNITKYLKYNKHIYIYIIKRVH